MSAPLTIEQIILNHNIGVNLSDAGTFQGKGIEQFSMVGHQHSASDIVSGVIDPNRLPISTQNSRGAVALSTSTNSEAQDVAAAASSVNAVRLMAQSKANATHKHDPGDINAGTFPGIMKASSNTSYTTKQLRNIYLGVDKPSDTIGSDGDVYFQYE